MDCQICGLPKTHRLYKALLMCEHCDEVCSTSGCQACK